jgi:hypothetical protein
VIDRELLRELADNRAKGAMLASIGGLLAYSPRKPRADAIAKPICVWIPAELRDSQARFIADTPAGTALCDLTPDDSVSASAHALHGAHYPTITKVTLRIDDTTSINAVRDSAAGFTTPFAATIDARSIHGSCAIPEMIKSLRSAGALAVHLRLESAHAARIASGVIAARPEIISVDMHADSTEGFKAATGRDEFTDALAGLESLATLAREMDAADRPWIVPRMTKRDAAYADLESFVDKWTLVFGHAAIDAFEGAPDTERVHPLPMPRSAQQRFANEMRTVDLRGETKH